MDEDDFVIIVTFVVKRGKNNRDREQKASKMTDALTEAAESFDGKIVKLEAGILI